MRSAEEKAPAQRGCPQSPQPQQAPLSSNGGGNVPPPPPATAGPPDGASTGATGAPALATGTIGPLVSDEPVHAHFAPRTLQEAIHDLAAAGGCVIDTTLDRAGKPCLLALHVPGRATHVIDVERVGDMTALASVLGTVRTAGFSPALPSQVKLKGWDVWDGRVAAETLYAGLTPPAPSLEDVAARLGLDLPNATTMAPEFPKARDVRDAAKKAVATALVVDRLGVQIRALDLEDTLSLDLGVRRSLHDLSDVGIRVDKGSWNAFHEAKRIREAELRTALQTALGIENLHDTDAVRDRLRDHGIDLPSSRTDDLLQHEDSPVVRNLIEWRTVSAFLNDSGKNVSAALEASTDGRVHAVWNVHGTATGRITCMQPNLLGLPRAGRVHFIPNQGCVFVNADLVAAQLCVLAEVTGDAALIQVFSKGEDPHLATARSLSRPGTVVDRERAKPVNFGIPFGMKARGLVAHARSQFGVDFSLEEAEFYLDRYRTSYPQVAAWQARVAKHPPREVRSIGGRVRRYIPGDTDVPSRLASQIQATEADALKRALLMLSEELPQLGARVVLVAYDAVLVECPKEKADATKAVVERCLRQGLAHYLKRVPVAVKAEVRRTWGA